MSKQENNNNRTFDRADTSVKRITKIKKSDGNIVPFTPAMKDVYFYLYTFQTNTDRPNYPEPIHPNMELIAWENGFTKPTAQKAIDDLEKAGVLTKGQVQVKSGFKSNNYIVLLPEEVERIGITPPRPGEAKNSKSQKSQLTGAGSDEQNDNLGSGEQSRVEQSPVPVVQPAACGDVIKICHDEVVHDTETCSAAPQRADIDTLRNWQEGYDDDGFMAYGRMWGLDKTGDIANLIFNHIKQLERESDKLSGRSMTVRLDDDGHRRPTPHHVYSSHPQPQKNIDDDEEDIPF